jgi:exodeoxyribonuclease V alpha subunit
MKFNIDIHFQFADFFDETAVKPFAYLLSKQMQDGHICLDLNQAFLKVDYPEIFKMYSIEADSLDPSSLKDSKVCSLNNEKRPLVIHKNKLYLYRYFNYEGNIINYVEKLIENGIQQKVNREIVFNENTAFSHNRSKNPDDLQLAASYLGYLNNFSIITGGPGTGKTTSIAKVLSIVYELEPKCRVAIAAPTGKAAMRVKESLINNNQVSEDLRKIIKEELEPKTIHRLLGYIYKTPYFRHNNENHLEYDLIIVDESSMIDVALFSKFLSAINPACRLILMGDKNQLASVDAGSIFGDLCSSFPGQVVELTQSYRFGEKSGIGIFSKAILSGDETAVKYFIKNNTDSSIQFDSENKPNLLDTFIADYEEIIKETDIKKALEMATKLRVLCAIKDGEKGLKKINQRIEKYLYKKGLITSTADIYSNKLVIVTKNYYDLELFNGDVGIIRRDENKQHRVYFLDKKNELRSVVPGLIPEMETVFAMTIHKSQGSEYDKVLIILPDNADNPLITRELLYTAITRAKSKVIIQGTTEVILTAVQKQIKRTSGIFNRINN